MPEDRIRSSLQVSATTAADAVRDRWKAFISAHPDTLRAFLQEQVKIAAVEQEATTMKQGDVNSLRTELHALIEVIVAESSDYFGQIPESDVLEGWRLSTREKTVDKIVRPLGNLLVHKGYDPGSKSSHPGTIPDWYYYQSSQWSEGLQRSGTGMWFDAKPLAEYHEAVDNYSRAHKALEAHDREVARRTIADAWA